MCESDVTLPALPPRDDSPTVALGPSDFGPYRIIEVLGGGGMGIVYKAEDTRLGRTVAIKILPPDLMRDPLAKARFLQEARAASSLDHPNLCTVYDVGETAARQLYLVMPCYDGETVRRRIDSRGPLPVAEALDLAAQALKGLAKAHRHGIVHRDIKPANLIVTGDGVLKIVDFGISKLAGAAADLTRTGLAIGTPSYMSPEQTMGQEVDARTDLWALGVVLYEMLSGSRPFTGASEPALQAGIVGREPEPIRRLRPDVPAEAEGILRRLLAKNREERYTSAEAVLDDLRVLLGTVASAAPLAGELVPVARRTLRLWVGAAAALALLAVIAASAGYWLRSGGGGAEAAATSVTRLTDQEGQELFPSLSPDGQYFVFAKAAPGGSDLYLQRIGGGNPILLTPNSPGDDTQPAFSPDGQQIAFHSERDGGGLFLMGATGESIRRLTEIGYNPAWSPDGREIAYATEGISSPAARISKSRLWRVDVATGTRRLVVAEELDEDAVQPSWSPSGRRIAYWGLPAGSGRRVLSTVSVSGGSPTRLTDDTFLNWNPVWSPDGRYLYFASDRSGSMNLWRVRIDEPSGRILGDPEPITTPSPWSGLLSVSRDGRRILYVSDTSESNVEAVAFDPEAGRVGGAVRPVTRGARAVRALSVSPDGGWIAFDTAAPREDLFLVRPDGSGLRQLTSDEAKDRLPRWSPDSREIVFYSNRSGRYEAWAIHTDGSGLGPLTRTTGPSMVSPIWSPDGRWLICGTEQGQGTGWIDLRQPLAARRLRLLPGLGGRSLFTALSWSSDGRWLAGSVRGGPEPTGIYLYSMATGAYRRITSWGVGALWVPGHAKLLVWDAQRLAFLDAVTGEVRDTGAPSPGPHDTPILSFSPDGRELYRVRANEKSDIWMLDLEERSGFAKLSSFQAKR